MGNKVSTEATIPIHNISIPCSTEPDEENNTTYSVSIDRTDLSDVPAEINTNFNELKVAINNFLLLNNINQKNKVILNDLKNKLENQNTNIKSIKEDKQKIITNIDFIKEQIDKKNQEKHTLIVVNIILFILLLIIIAIIVMNYQNLRLKLYSFL